MSLRSERPRLALALALLIGLVLFALSLRQSPRGEVRLVAQQPYWSYADKYPVPVDWSALK